MGKLTAKEVAGLTAPGRYTDGDGLMLYVDSQGRRYWQLRYRWEGKRRDLSLGAVRTLSLRDAREAALKARLLIRDGVDPIARRRTSTVSAITFADAAGKVHDELRPSWKNGKHIDQWLSTLKNHAFPLIGEQAVSTLTRADMVSVLSPIWLSHEETARRVLHRMRTVIYWAVGTNIRDEGIDFEMVQRALPRQKGNVTNVRAIHFTEVPDFLRTLTFSNASPVVRAAIELMILTASRPGNIRFMTWEEIYLERSVWRIPGEKMKRDRDYYVPLVPRAIELLRVMETHRSPTRPWVFPGEKPGRPMSENTKCQAIHDMGVNSTAHGFRSTFKDWARAAEWEEYLSEFQLAHLQKNKTVRAYGRDGHLHLRREMMGAWADCIAGRVAMPVWEEEAMLEAVKVSERSATRREPATVGRNIASSTVSLKAEKRRA